MLGKVLTAKDYNEIIDTCIQCKSSYGIKDFINNVSKEFGKTNTDLETNLMEIIDLRFSDLIAIPELNNDDYTNVQEELNIPNANIEYLFSYLIHLSETNANTYKEKPLVFRTTYNSNQLTKILLDLQEKQFIEEVSIENIIWVFNGQIQVEKDCKIEWIDISPRSKQVNSETLIYFLKKIFKSISLKKEQDLLCNEIIKRFCKTPKDYTLSGLKSIIKRSRNKIELIEAGKSTPHRRWNQLDLILKSAHIVTSQ